MGLSLKETAKLVSFVNGIKQAGKSAIFIDHNIFHVYPIADRIVVLDRGTVAGQFMKAQKLWGLCHIFVRDDKVYCIH